MKNDDDEESFSNYFKSHCHPKCPDITVQQIEHKKTQFLAQVAAKFGLKASSKGMYNFGVGPRFAYVSASARAPK